MTSFQRRWFRPRNIPEIGALDDATGPPSASAAQAAEAVSLVAAAVARAHDVAGVCETIVDQAVRLGAKSAHLFRADEAARELRLAAYRNLPPELAGSIGNLSYEDNTLLASRTARTRAIQFVDDTETLERSLPAAAELFRKTGARSALSIPLTANDRLFGVLTWSLSERHAFSQDDLAVVRALAKVFAIGLDTAEHRERERKLRDEVRAAEEALRESVAREQAALADAEAARARLVALDGPGSEPG
jgi:GAF domain-containing protein